MVIICSSIYFSSLHQHWETLILQLLKWDINAVTPHDFLPQVLSRLPLPVNEAQLVQRHAQTFVALCLATGELSF